MKRIVKCLLLIISIFFINIYSVYAEEDINIKSIRVVGQSGTITLNDLDYSGNNIYSNIIFNQVNDFVTYEVELENSSYKKFLLESVSISNSEYLTASSDEVNTYIEPKGTSVIQLKVKYENELINQEEINLDNLSLTLNYSYEGITNPETGFNVDNIILFIIALSLIGVGFVLFKIKKKQVIVLFLLLPMFVLAKEYKPVTITFSNVKVKGRLLNYRVEVDNGSGEFSLRQRTYGEEVGMLATPTKSGYTFTGWKDQDGNSVTEETQIEKDTVVSAQYEPIEYTITYNLDGGVLSKENPTTYTTEDEFTINNPTKEGYTFVGWDIGIAIYPNLTFYKGMINDRTFTALYTQEPTAQYTVIHKKENDAGEFVEVERELFSGPVGLRVCPLSKRYEGYYTWGDCLTITEDGLSSVTYNYSRAKLRFEVTPFDGLDTENSNQSGAYPYGTIITLNAEERPGYTLWWSDGKTGFTRTFTLTKNTTLSAQYIPNGNVQYKVIHKLQSLDTGMIGRDEINQVNDGYYVKDISYFDGLIGEEVEPPTNIYEGFTAPSVERITLSEDSSRTITYYYTRNKYRLTIEEEENVETDTPSGEYYYGTWINLKAKKIEGYSFDHWSDGSTNNPYGFELKGDTTIKAIYGDPAAIFDSGISVNQKMKRLAGNSGASYSTQDNNIQQIVKANALPDGFSPTSDNIVSSSNSDYPIYMWYEDNVIYYYTRVNLIYLNNNSSYMFQELRLLESIDDIGEWNTSRVLSTERLFRYAGNDATSFVIDVSNWDMSNVTNMFSTFASAGYNATTWSVGDLSNWNTSKATNMQSVFNCAGYSAVVWNVGDLSNWDTSKATNMSYMFQGAGHNAESFDISYISNWDVSSAVNMYYMFASAGFNSTTWSIGDLSNWNTSNVVNMGVMFANAGRNVTNWNVGDLSNWNTSKVTNMSYMFQGAGYSSDSFDISFISNWDTSKVTNMCSMFNDAGQNARSWNIGNLSNWDTSKVTNMMGMFQGAGYSSNSFDISFISNWDTSKVTNMMGMFASAGFNSTTWSIGDLSNWNTSKVTNMTSMFSQAGRNASTWNDIGKLKIYADNISNMFGFTPRARGIITLYSNPASYSNAFSNAATTSGSGITVNYTSDVTNIDNIIATKSNNSNVYKGSLIR